MRGRAHLSARLRRAVRRHAVWVNLAVVLAILGLAGQVPPDGALAAIRSRAVLRVCTPEQGLNEAEAAAIEALAAAIPARLSLTPLAGIGRDANPRNWRLSRAQCDVIAGGLADTPTSRSFLAVVPIGVQTGWAIRPGPLADCRHALVWPGVSGLSRVALSRYLRAEGVRAQPVPDLATARDALRRGEGDCLIAPLADLARLDGADEGGAGADMLDVPGAPIVSLGLGFWKGDATLTRLMRKIIAHQNG